MTEAVRQYVRYEYNATTGYGILAGDTVTPVRGGLFDGGGPAGKTLRLDEVRLLWPCEPTKILAVGRNYKSHLGTRPAPTRPELFYKPLSALLAPGGKIVIPPDAGNVHYEGELVLVIGKITKGASPTEAAASIFGCTCGNDVSERDWQKNDLQWWRAKGADTFAPFGPAISVGLDYGALRLQTRVNGDVKQSQTTADLLFDAAEIVSHASRHVTLYPGDVIYTGTPGTTSPLKPGDTVEVEIEGVGVLRNEVV